MRRLLVPASTTTATFTAVATLLGLALALQKFAAPDRIAALDTVGCAHGLSPLPGQPACPAR